MKTSPLIVHRPGPPAEDDYGNQVPGPPTDIAGKGLVVPLFLRNVREISQGQQTGITNAEGYITEAGDTRGANTDVRLTDEITAEGVRYQVVGKFAVRSGSGRLDCAYVDLKAVE